MTQGYSPATMHVDPVTGVPYTSEAAPGVTVVVAPVSSGPSIWLLAALALGAWYAYKQGWLSGILNSLGMEGNA